MSDAVELPVEGPFSLDLLLRTVRRRPNEIVDLAIEGEYRRLLAHRGRRLLLRVAEGEEGMLTLSLHGVDGPPDADDAAVAALAVRRVLSLDRSPQPFYDHVRDEPVLAPLTARLRGLRPLGSPTIFEMLMAAILGQQISLAAAGAIKSRLVRSLGASAEVEGRAYHAFPTPEALAGASREQLVALAFSRRKAEYVRDLATAVADGDLDLEALRGAPHAAILERLVALRGIGRWTAEYVLLRGYGYPDALPAGDAGLRRQIRRCYALPAPPDEATITAMAAPWAPYRSWATLYLWNADLLETQGPLRGQ